MVRSFRVIAEDKGRVRVTTRVEIVTEPGFLTRGEVIGMKMNIADQIMAMLPGITHLHVHLSEIKVTR